MPLPDPRTASPRPDLTFLRHRARPRPAAASAAPSGAPSRARPQTAAPAGPDLHAALGEFVAGRAGGHRHPGPDGPATPSTGGSALDLGSPVAGPAALAAVPPPTAVPPRTAVPPGAPTGGSPLDLGPSSRGVQPGPAAPATGGSALDLGSSTGGTVPARPAAAARPAPRGPGPGPSEPELPVRRLHPTTKTLLTASDPTVVLTRVQSAVGALWVEAVTGPAAGDLRLACAFALAGGRSSVVDLAGGRRTGPLRGGRPVVVAQREGRDDRLGIDLRQVGGLQRLLVVGFSPTGVAPVWDGTLVVTTTGGHRVEAALAGPPGATAVALLSVHVADGELVLRSEMDPVAPTLRGTCTAFGYDLITWVDERTPLD